MAAVSTVFSVLFSWRSRWLAEWRLRSASQSSGIRSKFALPQKSVDDPGVGSARPGRNRRPRRSWRQSRHAAPTFVPTDRQSSPIAQAPVQPQRAEASEPVRAMGGREVHEGARIAGDGRSVP